jgi:hypothetical protein
LVEKDLNSNPIKDTVYVYLLNEGTDSWRPVNADYVNKDTYLLHGQDIYNPSDEEWEFPPGTLVLTEIKKLSSGNSFLVAIQKA